MKSDYKRGPNDKKWKGLVQEVRERDRVCRLMRILKVHEMHQLLANAPKPLLNTFDPAHVIAVSSKPAMRYDKDNVVLLNRFSHDNLDHNRCPLTGKSIPRTHVHQWWSRIVGLDKYKELIGRMDNHPEDDKE
ncbi:MAG: hypothetical protein LC650_02190 [Actinobacteria bacterium]|nr:hypothetical protein [Actinomycetota bacterium]